MGGSPLDVAPESASTSVPSLHSLAKRACIRNIRAIVDVGDAEYDQVRGILLKVPNPEQLQQIEASSSQIIGHTGELWRTFIRRDIEEYTSKDPPEPKNPASWYKLYKKLRSKEAAEIKAQEEMLTNQLRGIQEDAAKHTSKMVDPKSVPRLPRAGGMRIEKGRAAGSSKIADASKLRFMSGSKTKTTSGRDVLNRARREAKEMSLFHTRNSALSRPTHQLNDRATQLKSAPKAMINKRTMREGEMLAGSIAVPRRRSSLTGPLTAATSASRREPEKRSGLAKRDADLSGMDDGDDLDTSGEEPERKMRKVPRLVSQNLDGSPARSLVPKARLASALFMERKRKPPPKR